MTIRIKSLAFFTLLNAVSCRSNLEQTSHVSGALTETTPVCSDYSQAQYDALDAQLQGLPFFNNFNDAEHKELLKHFHAVPKVYRDLMISQSKSGEFRGFFKEAIESSGVCSYNRGANGCNTIKLSSTQRNVIQFSMIHEVGHGMELQGEKKSGLSSQAFDQKMTQLLNEGRAYNNSGRATNGRNRIRAYSFTSINEFWADSFHNYYCSPESNNFIKTNLPQNYAFISSILEKPVWATDTGDVTPTPIVNDPKAAEHYSSLLSLYNEDSKSCALSFDKLTPPTPAGDFQVTVKVAKKGGMGDASEPLTLKSNIQKQLARELSELRRGLPTLASNCAE